MTISQKCQYALRAIFELSRRYRQGPTIIAEVAEVQAIPPKFLELILGELRQGGFVESRRGKRGGYLLSLPPDQVTVGQIIRFIEGPIAPVKCIAGQDSAPCPLHGRCAFIGLWERAENAVAEVYDTTTLQDLIDQDASMSARYVDSYCI